ncbi:MAG: DDE-type integrase/transposase/recombinase, partial [bacterium]
ETVTALCDHYDMSRRWFYNWKPRWEQLGPDGMASRRDGPVEMPHALDEEVLGQIIDYVKQNPSHGCDRIADNLEADVSARTIQRYLNALDLGTRKQRQTFHRCQNGAILTEKELSKWASDRRKSKDRHVAVSFPGELVGVDLFYIGTIKGIGRIYQFTAVDCYSSFGFAGIYTAKTAENAVDFIKTHVAPYFGDRPLLRVLSDNGKEFTTHWENGSHTFTDALNEMGIRQTTTKVKHPWTNGHVERFQQTVLHEFYQRV